MRIPYLLAGSTSAILASAVCCRPALCQWAVTTEIGAERFWGGSVESSAEHRSFRPYRPTTLGIGLERNARRLGGGLRLRYSSAALALEGKDAVVAAKGIFTVYGAAAEIVYRICSVGSVNQLSLRAGPLLEVWSMVDEEAQTRLGVQGGLSLSVPLGGRFAGGVTAGAAVIPSPFGKTQLDPGFERRALWRRRFAVGLDYRL